MLGEVVEIVVVLDHLADDLADGVAGEKEEVNYEHGPEHIDLQQLEAGADGADGESVSYA